MAATADTRTRILNACHTLLVSDTGASTRMSDIAKAAGLSRQAVYLHFKTRAELLIALTRHIDEVEDVTGRLAPSRAATSLKGWAPISKRGAAIFRSSIPWRAP